MALCRSEACRDFLYLQRNKLQVTSLDSLEPGHRPSQKASKWLRKHLTAGATTQSCLTSTKCPQKNSKKSTLKMRSDWPYSSLSSLLFSGDQEIDKTGRIKIRIAWLCLSSRALATCSSSCIPPSLVKGRLFFKFSRESQLMDDDDDMQYIS